MSSPLSNDTPLDELPIVSLDLETTGLDAARDRIVQIAIVQFSVVNGQFTLLESLVNPEVPIPARSTEIHGISERDITYAPTYAEIQNSIRKFVKERVVVGHHIGFDLAVLRHESARLKRAWKPPPSLDVALLAAALNPTLDDHSMESVSGWLGVPITSRHTALGDSQVAASCFDKLIPRLKSHGIHSLGEAKEFEASKSELIAQERHVGWYHDSSLDPRAHNSTYQEQVGELREVKNSQANRAREELADGVSAVDIQVGINTCNIELHRQALALCLEEFVELGLGEPPVAFDALILGSGARGESLLLPDQDNVFLLDNRADSDFLAIDDWFEKLAVRMIDTLADIGFYRCPGWVMASNPRWRKSADEFEKQFAQWIKEARGDALHYCNIALDHRHFHGEGSLARTISESISDQTRNSRFLSRLYDIHKNQTGALGWFGRLITNPNPGPNHGKIELKTGGTMPLVTAVRILSLYHGIREPSTRERINQLSEKGLLQNADELWEAFSHITFLLLRKQIEDHRSGAEINNYLLPQSISREERKRLVAALKNIRHFCQQVAKKVQQPVE